MGEPMMESATTYILYTWDCPYCGTPQETSDIEPEGECVCDDCGESVEVLT